jgi:hypothetical protein
MAHTATFERFVANVHGDPLVIAHADSLIRSGMCWAMVAQGVAAVERSLISNCNVPPVAAYHLASKLFRASTARDATLQRANVSVLWDATAARADDVATVVRRMKATFATTGTALHITAYMRKSDPGFDELPLLGVTVQASEDASAAAANICSDAYVLLHKTAARNAGDKTAVLYIIATPARWTTQVREQARDLGSLAVIVSAKADVPASVADLEWRKDVLRHDTARPTCPPAIGHDAADTNGTSELLDAVVGRIEDEDEYDAEADEDAAVRDAFKAHGNASVSKATFETWLREHRADAFPTAEDLRQAWPLLIRRGALSEVVTKGVTLVVPPGTKAGPQGLASSSSPTSRHKDPDMSMLEQVMRDFARDGNLNPLKSAVGDRLRIGHPAQFPDRDAVRGCLAKGIASGLFVGTGEGPMKRVHLATAADAVPSVASRQPPPPPPSTNGHLPDADASNKTNATVARLIVQELHRHNDQPYHWAQISNVLGQAGYRDKAVRDDGLAYGIRMGLLTRLVDDTPARHPMVGLARGSTTTPTAAVADAPSLKKIAQSMRPFGGSAPDEDRIVNHLQMLLEHDILFLSEFVLRKVLPEGNSTLTDRDEFEAALMSAVRAGSIVRYDGRVALPQHAALVRDPKRSAERLTAGDCDKAAIAVTEHLRQHPLLMESDGSFERSVAANALLQAGLPGMNAAEHRNNVLYRLVSEGVLCQKLHSTGCKLWFEGVQGANLRTVRSAVKAAKGPAHDDANTAVVRPLQRPQPAVPATRRTGDDSMHESSRHREVEQPPSRIL